MSQDTHTGPPSWRADAEYVAQLFPPLPALPATCVRPGRSRAPVSPRVRLEVYQRDGWRCTVCARTDGDLSAPSTTWTRRYDATRPAGDRSVWAAHTRQHAVVLTVDHLLAVAAGGCSHAHNLRALCSQCNARRGHRGAL